VAGEGQGRIKKRTDGIWFLRLPKEVCEDTTFPFEDGEVVLVSFEDDELKVKKKEEK